MGVFDLGVYGPPTRSAYRPRSLRDRRCAARSGRPDAPKAEGQIGTPPEHRVRNTKGV